jgi:hypothetical protein
VPDLTSSAADLVDVWERELPSRDLQGPSLRDNATGKEAVRPIDVLPEPLLMQLFDAGVSPDELKMRVSLPPDLFAALRSAPASLVRVSAETAELGELLLTGGFGESTREPLG